MIESDKNFLPSRLFLYTCEVMYDNKPGEQIQDEGANAAEGCSILSTKGVCSEAVMPYDVNKFGEAPTDAQYADALLHKYPAFSDVTNNGTSLDVIKNCISNNQPVLMSFIVFQSFMEQTVRQTGILPSITPADYIKGPLGGHEVVCVGYDSQYLTILNSWGENWGDKGFFKMPLSYLTSHYLANPAVMQLLILGDAKTLPPVPPKKHCCVIS